METVVISDLGGGDGGKGTTIDAVGRELTADIVLKRGGSNGMHGVTTSSGEHHPFNHWGCCTFSNVPTFITSDFVAFPWRIEKEGATLKYGFGIDNAFELLKMDEMALCATPYHGAVSRILELARRENSRGTIGTGVGVAYRDMEAGMLTVLHAGDLGRSDLKDLLATIRHEQSAKIADLIDRGFFLSGDMEYVRREKILLENDDFFYDTVAQLAKVPKLIEIVDREYLQREIVENKNCETTIVETSHGVLTDHYYGFFPHVSALRTLPVRSYDLLRTAGHRGEIKTLGVFRAYAIRHGAGPLPTDEPLMYESLLPGSTSQGSRFRGSPRVGPLDLVLLKYAIEVVGGPSTVRGLAVSWFDQVQANGEWKICRRYRNTLDPEFFTPDGRIKVRRGADAAQLEYQENLGKRLLQVEPEIETLRLPSGASREELFEFCAGILEPELGVPVRIVSFGPTERDKVFK